jgi:hypothetical protein
VEESLKVERLLQLDQESRITLKESRWGLANEKNPGWEGWRTKLNWEELENDVNRFLNSMWADEVQSVTEDTFLLSSPPNWLWHLNWNP